jgi:2-keto-3-deoxy-L-rhamnonate aldolase RhmA
LSAAFDASIENGTLLVAVNPGLSPVPDAMDGANALFIDCEGTGLGMVRSAKMVEDAKDRRLISMIRTDGLGPVAIGAALSAKPDVLVLPQVTTEQSLKDCMAHIGSENVGVIAQVETVEAVDCLEALMRVDEVSAFLIGPNDLATAMGHPGQPTHPEVVAAVDRVARRLSAAGKAFGLPALTKAAAEMWKARGAQLLYVPLAAFQTMELKYGN